MLYAQAVEQLTQLGGELVSTPGTPKRKFELDHMRTLTAALGSPQGSFPSVLIAGTNGKGSTAAMLASILSCSGYRTGLYTSPHLQRVNERIQLSEPRQTGNTLQPIRDEIFAALFQQVSLAASTLVDNGSLPHLPSFFEVLTGMAFLAFAQAQVNIAVLEVGMGGRLDATNVVDPIASVITDISLDHTEWLGSTLGEIAREKAGILRRNGTMIILPQHPEVNQAVGEIAVDLGVTGINAAKYMPEADNLSSVRVPLEGRHQERNCALVLAASWHLQQSKGLIRIGQGSIAAGLRQVQWPGRLERTQLHWGTPLLLDVAHNPAGAWSLRSYLSSAFSKGELPAPHMLIFSAYRDKAIREILQILLPLFEEPGDCVAFVPMPGARAASAADMESIAAAMEVTAVSFIRVEEAFFASQSAGVGSVIVTGSVHLIGQAKDTLEHLQKTWPA